MSGKTKLDIVKDGLVAYFDAGNPLSNNQYQSSLSRVYNWPVVARNIAFSYEKKSDIGRLDFLYSKGDFLPTYSNENGGIWEFDGINDYLFFFPEETFAFDTLKNYTISLWVRIDTFPSSQLYTILKFTDQGGNHIFLNVYKLSTSGVMGIETESDAEIFNATFEVTRWYNITITTFPNEDGLSYTMLVYLNGKLNAKSYAVTRSRLYPSLIGSADGFANMYYGKLANLMFYNVGLSQSQVIQNYNALKYRFEPNIGIIN